MRGTKQIIRYDYNYLQKYCKENGIELLKNYLTENINIYTKIEGKCLKCSNNFSKGRPRYKSYVLNFLTYCCE